MTAFKIAYGTPHLTPPYSVGAKDRFLGKNIHAV